MKTCPECGNESPDMAVICINCKYSYPIGYHTYVVPSNASSKIMIKRPMGETYIKSGSILIIISIVGMLIIGFLGSEQLSTSLLIEIAILGGIFSLGLRFLTIGQIQRAIWFLPGEDQKQIDD